MALHFGTKYRPESEKHEKKSKRKSIGPLEAQSWYKKRRIRNKIRRFFTCGIDVKDNGKRIDRSFIANQ